LGDFLSAETTPLPEWVGSEISVPTIGFVNPIEVHFVRIGPGSLTLDGKEVFAYRSEDPHRSLAGFLLIVEKGMAPCGCYAERSCIAQRGQEHRIDEEYWIGFLCRTHSFQEIEVSVPDMSSLLIPEKKDADESGSESTEDD